MRKLPDQEANQQSQGGKGHAHHVVVHAGGAHGDKLEGFQGAGSGHHSIGGRNGWYDVLDHALRELQCDALRCISSHEDKSAPAADIRHAKGNWRHSSAQCAWEHQPTASQNASSDQMHEDAQLARR